MKKLYEYIHHISQNDIQKLIQDKDYDEDDAEFFKENIARLQTLTPIDNDNIIFALYGEMLFIQPPKDEPFVLKKKEEIFYTPLCFVKQLDLSQQFSLRFLSDEQILGAYVVLDDDYDAVDMVLLILNAFIMDSHDIREQINEIIGDIQKQFPYASVSAVGVLSPQEELGEWDIQNMEPQIIQQQMTIQEQFQQKLKDYYQSILYS